MYSVYLLKCSDGSLYCGIAKDLRKRMAFHNKGTASKYTRARLPVSLAYFEKAKTRSAALKREIEIKKMRREEKMRLANRRSFLSNCGTGCGGKRIKLTGAVELALRPYSESEKIHLKIKDLL